MSWSITAEITKQNAASEIMDIPQEHITGEGAKYQVVKAKEAAVEFISSDAVRGEKFNVSLSGHSQADSPGSASDTIVVTIYARSKV